jgi:Asp-tRNA(Asn)/Glu-tRNA(Gln) amidotransferase A subunit family amidase
VAVKDLIAVAGLRIGAGNPRWLSEAAVQRESAPVVEQLLAQGACVGGIAQTDEFAYSLSGTNVHYGTPPNPRAPECIPGGSSSGPASAVALGQAEVGLGTDTAGSIRVPASYLGLHGMRPTHGALSAVGVEPLAPSFDTIGWLAADASTLAATGRALLPTDGGADDPTALMLATDLLALAEPEVADAVRRAAAQLADAIGMPLREGVSPAGECLDSWFAAFRTVQGAEAHESRGGWVAAHPSAVGPGIAARFAEAAQITVSQRAQAESVVAAARERTRDALAESRTLLVLPATSSVAPRRDQRAEPKAATRAATLRLTCLASIAGVPAVVLPSGKADPPVGLCLVGAAGADRALLGLVERSAR